jgi:hypothetical protein
VSVDDASNFRAMQCIYVSELLLLILWFISQRSQKIGLCIASHGKITANKRTGKVVEESGSGLT